MRSLTAQILTALGRNPFDALPIPARRSAVAGYFPPCGFQCRRACCLVHQAEPFASFDAVTQRRQHAFRPDRGFYPRPVAVGGVCGLYSPVGHFRRLGLLRSVFHASTFLPPFPRSGFAFRPSLPASSCPPLPPPPYSLPPLP